MPRCFGQWSSVSVQLAPFRCSDVGDFIRKTLFDWRTALIIPQHQQMVLFFAYYIIPSIVSLQCEKAFNQARDIHWLNERGHRTFKLGAICMLQHFKYKILNLVQSPVRFPSIVFDIIDRMTRCASVYTRIQRPVSDLHYSCLYALPQFCLSSMTNLYSSLWADIDNEHFFCIQTTV